MRGHIYDCEMLYRSLFMNLCRRDRRQTLPMLLLLLLLVLSPRPCRHAPPCPLGLILIQAPGLRRLRL